MPRHLGPGSSSRGAPPPTVDQAVAEGTRLLRSGDPVRAGKLYAAALGAAPQHVDALQLLGLVRWQQQRRDEALRRMRAALALAPADPIVHANFAGMRTELGRFEEAVRHYRAAIALTSGQADAHSNLAIALKSLGRLDQALASCRRALALRPDLADPHSNLGDLLSQTAHPSAAIRATRRALALNPLLDRARRNLLTICLYDPTLSAEVRFALHLRHGARPGPAPRPMRLRVSPDPGRPLRIGYLSSDFRWHPVGRNMLPILEAHDRHRMPAHLYSTTPVEDDTTRRFRATTPRFRALAGQSEAAIAEAVADDRIDILVVLAAHFDENPIQVARFRPAPLIASFHDAATSGLGEVDHLISDAIMAPRRTTERFTERVVRLPSLYVYTPDGAAPPALRQPRRPGEGATFASLNNPAKLNDAVLALWAEILARSPGARLLLQYRDLYRSPALAGRIRASMADRGIAPDRVELLDAVADHLDHLALYDRADVVLDCFPFNGATTTFEALWMGVPVVTLEGDAIAGRTAASLLRTLGLGEFAAPTPEVYAAIAASLAADEPRLDLLRGTLRDRIAGSTLLDGTKVARNLERIYRAMWRRWCRMPR
jgi:protein O-GlcNAc transferase